MITTVQFTTKEIPGTEFSKWYIEKTVEADGKTTESKYYGIGRTKDLEQWNSVDAPGWNIKAEKAYRGHAVPAAISKIKYEKMRNAELHVTEAVESVTCDNIDSDDYLLFLWNVGSHQLLDFHEEFVEYPIHIDYMDFVSNANYDLDEMMKILKASPYVINADNLTIERIPYYNASEHSTHHIPCHVLMTREDFQKYQDIRQKNSFGAKKFILKDILGLIEKECVED
jgi:uncharacterized short protein YbdD (DUF466 family)